MSQMSRQSGGELADSRLFQPNPRPSWRFNPTFGRIMGMASSAKGSGAQSGRRRRSALAQAAVPEKEKISITLDKALVDEIRAHFGGRALSASINELLHVALAQERLDELVGQMEQEAGPASPEAYDRVLAQWFAEG
jgi:hypothetical protein